MGGSTNSICVDLNDLWEGGLILLTMGLSYVVSATFLAGTALVGAGLGFAGVSDTCMMGNVPARMPCNCARGGRG